MQFSPAARNPLLSRHDVQRLATDLTNPLLPHFSPGKAGVRPGSTLAWYGEPSSSLEGFSRPLWGIAPLTAGGGIFPQWNLWREGLINGTDPAHPEFWGWPQDHDQRTVESAALGFSLNLVPAKLWEPLPEAARHNLATWLGRINSVRAVDNNWLFFQVMVNLGLRRVGLPHAPEVIDTNLQRLDEFHLGGGWYADGEPGPSGNDGRIGDYYVPMAMHFYGLIYAVASDTTDAIRAQLYRERARQLAQDFVHWFTADGAAVPFGRSMAYRFAQGAFWGALAYANVEAQPWPVIKGLYLRHLRWWMQQPIFSETGLLSIGYGYPNLHMAESYNGPASPYWAMKAFLPLALPETHPFWQAEEAPLPARRAVFTAAYAKLVLTAAKDAREVVALNPGQCVADWPRHAAHKYSKFAYSTRFGFSVPVGLATLQEGGFDNVLALSDDSGRRFRARESVEAPSVQNGVAHSRWSPWSDVTIDTWLIAAGDAHVRVHRLHTARALTSAETGFATGYSRRETLATESLENKITVTTPLGSSAVTNLNDARTGACVELGANSHLLFPLAAMPVLRGEHAPGIHWLACLVQGSATHTHETTAFAFIATVNGFEIRESGALWCDYRDGQISVKAHDLIQPAKAIEGATA
ncbi:DUF2264 domain-containing protein [Oleiharenicola lentus]|uniref:DUF2264 domain-containing protein n=1 Tax=Oleiharenicola lentus TaxID=2508720 RepID=UPI003F681B60